MLDITISQDRERATLTDEKLDTYILIDIIKRPERQCDCQNTCPHDGKEIEWHMDDYTIIDAEHSVINLTKEKAKEIVNKHWKLIEEALQEACNEL